jgi:formate hydrogenlyase subunit 3/multisubunit Na+/H+ antiporter MnhD subunit
MGLQNVIVAILYISLGTLFGIASITAMTLMFLGMIFRIPKEKRDRTDKTLKLLIQFHAVWCLIFFESAWIITFEVNVITFSVLAFNCIAFTLCDSQWQKEKKLINFMQ